jgi:exodeoxyribonuclease V gamma subunit
MEILMQGLSSILAEAGEDPLMPHWITVQSRGMKQWISLKLAESLGVCANMRFVFPRPLVDELLSHFTAFDHPNETVDEDFFFWSVLKLVREIRTLKELSGIDAYLREDRTGKRLFQVSRKIATLFDDYSVYRPDMLLDWQKGSRKEALQDPSAEWQAFLFQKMMETRPLDHPAARTQAFLQGFSKEKFNTAGLPSRISLFGISVLPELFVQVFEKVASVMDIHVFLLTPSSRFFFDIRPDREVEKRAVKEGVPPEFLFDEPVNPLLASLGAAGIRFHSGLEAFHYQEPFDDLFLDPVEEGVSMLWVLQSDILNLYHRKEGGETLPLAVDPSDTSISVHACHSPIREAQVLKDLLLAEFENNPDLAPHDIIVMMPDIEAYAPFIESVFSLETPLPFSISDRRKRSESEPLEVFLKILALQGSRLEKSLVLDLLLSGSIAGKFKISLDDTTKIEQMIDNANILWGRDGEHRKGLGFEAFAENTWQFGLNRLFMGMAMPEGYDGLVQGILPCESFEGLDLEVLGKLAAFCHALFSGLSGLEGEKTLAAWTRVFRQLARSMLDENPETAEDLFFLMETLDELESGAKKAGFTDAVSFDLVHSLLAQKLDLNISQGNFMSGNITFCNILPMRSIPFKIVVLMGMDESAFPKKVFSPGFNLMKKFPRPRDKNDRNEDLYLFLETLLSAREKFIITYTGMSIRDNSLIPCSGVVSELMEVMDQGFVFPKGYSYRFFHPLHPFDGSYFNGTGPLFSYSGDNCRMAAALLGERRKKRPFVEIPDQEKLGDPVQDISLDEVIRFFKNPLEGFVKSGLNLTFKLLEEEKEDWEAFTVAGLDQYLLGSLLLEKEAESPHDRDLYPVFRAMGSLPPGRKGRLEYEKLMALADPLVREARKIAAIPPLPTLAAEIQENGIRVSGRITHVRETGAYLIGFGRLNGSRLLSAWIRHLFLNAAGPRDYPRQTFLVGRDTRGKKPLSNYRFPDLGRGAEGYLEELVQIFQKGIQTPFYFSPETSFRFAEALAEEGFALTGEPVFKAMGRAKKAWQDRHQGTGERENRYVGLCVEDNDPFESVETLLSSGFAQNAIRVFKPLLENREELP